MNPFQKNPFISNSSSTIKGFNPLFDEKKKLDNIRENMAKNKFMKPMQEEKLEKEELSVNEKVNLLKNIDR